MPDLPHFSLIIPTHNRAESLRRALQSARALDYPADRLEILVIDNASADATPAVVREFEEVRCIAERRLGLHFARHGGARAARGEILLFTDDDATFSTGWVRAYATAFEAHSEMAAAGGPVAPVWEPPPPQWLLDYMGDYRPGFIMLSIWEPYSEFQLKPGGPFFFGVNLAIRRQALFRSGGFNPEAFGETWLGDGEAGLNRKLAARGEPVGYVPEARVYHHIPASRMTVDYLCRRMANEGACEIYAELHPRLPSRRELCRRALAIAWQKRQLWRAARRVRGQTDISSLNTQLEAARTWAQFAYLARLLFSRKLRQLVTKEDWL
jgi:glycosyltransferase involved in cell wall biosynthesis